MLDELVSAARRMARSPGFTFEQYGHLFSGLQRESVLRLLNQILQEILESAEDRAPPYFDQVHLVSEGDFNLTLQIAGRTEERGAHLTASELDLLVINLSEEPVSFPVYRTTLDVHAMHQRPGPLLGPEGLSVEPRGCRMFAAYAESADLASADRETPLLSCGRHALAPPWNTR